MRRFANLTALWLIVATLLACGGENVTLPDERLTPTPRATQTAPARKTPTPTARRTPAATATPFVQWTAADLRGARVRLWHAWRGEVFGQLVAAFNEQNEFGITVEAVYQGNYNDLYHRVREAIAAGGMPEIAIGYPYEILAWQEDGARLVNLTPYLNDPLWGLSAAEQADFYPIFWQTEGARYDFPAQRTAQLLAYNLSWARELGFSEPPQTPEEFREQACAAARANLADADRANDGSGGWVASTTPITILSWLYAFGSEVVRPDGTGYRFDTPQAEAAFRFLKSLEDNGCVWQPRGEGVGDGYGENEHAEAEFAARRALVIALPLTDLPYLSAAMEEAGNPDRWTGLAFPSDGSPVITVYGPSFAVFASTPEEELAAWIFLEWLLLPQNQARWVEAEGTFPLNAATMDYLDAYSEAHPQWVEAVGLLRAARPEPRLSSWGVARWAVGDAGAQIFRYYFVPDRIPAMLELLETTAEELNRRGSPHP